MRILMIVGILVLIACSSMQAQSPNAATFREIDLGLSSGFAREDESFRYIWFRDPVYGVVESRSGRTYHTTDGGLSWDSVDVPPYPQRLLEDGLGTASGGFVTNDGGATWTRFRIPGDSTVAVTGVVASSRRFILCTAESAEFKGWIFTADGGATWRRMNGAGGYVSTGDSARDSASIMQWPTPWWPDRFASYGATGPTPIGICEDSLVYAISEATRYDGNMVTRRYLWRINLSSGIVSWRRIVDGAIVDTLCFNTERPSSAFNHPFVDTYWQPLQGTWPFVTFALDSATRFVAGVYSFFARSTNAGWSWRRNDPAGRSLSVLAFSDRILIGRDYGSLLLSTDRGRSWNDRGREGGLPSGVGGIHALAEVVGQKGSGHIVALCRMSVHGDSVPQYRFLESHDGGSSWSPMPIQVERLHLSQKIDPVNLFAFGDDSVVTHMVIGAETGVHRSSDGGRTWERATLYDARQMSMSDSLHGYRLVPGGYIARTADGARTWQNVREPFSAFYLGFHSSSPDDFVVLWKGPGVRMKSSTTDGGATWQDEQVEGHREAMGAAQWIDSSRIVMVGTNGFIELSTDAGRTWTVASDSPLSIEGGRFGDYGNGMYVQAGDFNRAQLWDFDLDGPTAVPDHRPSSYRQPAHIKRSEHGRIRFDQAEVFGSRVYLVDLLGRRRTFDVVRVADGTGEVAIGDLPAGVYLLTADSPERWCAKVIVH